MGNWASVTTNGTTQTRTHNQQNEITSISGQTAPGYDSNGNTTTDQTGKTLVYDAWNRLVAYKSGSTTLAAYGYDAVGRIVQTEGGTTTDLYYSKQWQVLEERVGGVAKAQYVWSPVYVDALVERDRDPNNSGVLSERLYVQQDANWNVTALVNTSLGLQAYQRRRPLPVVVADVDTEAHLRPASAPVWRAGVGGPMADLQTI